MEIISILLKGHSKSCNLHGNLVVTQAYTFNFSDCDSMEDFLTLSQDISAAMEKFMDCPSDLSDHNNHLNEEEFAPPNLLHDRLSLDESN